MVLWLCGSGIVEDVHGRLFFEKFRLVRLISVNWPDFCDEELGFSFLSHLP